MNELLTQSEIDELLASIQGGNIQNNDTMGSKRKEVRLYDFRTAKRVPRDQIKTLNVVYETFARLLGTYLTGTLGILCKTSVISIEEQSYLEFTNAVSPSSVLAILKMPPLTGPLLMRLSPELSYSILECLLGGVNSLSNKHQVFTEIDLVILEKIIRHFLLQHNEAWEKVMKVNTLLDGIETSVQFAQIVPPTETILIVTLNVAILDTETIMNLCIPYPTIEPIAKILRTRFTVTNQDENEDMEKYEEEILQHLHQTPVILKASLSETTIRIEDLLNLQVGDVIQLEHKLSDPVKIDIGHIPKLYGVLGKKGSRYAVRITQISEEENKNNE